MANSGLVPPGAGSFAAVASVELDARLVKGVVSGNPMRPRRCASR
ncbi:hypothetical protein [Streptomyces zhihengii]